MTAKLSMDDRETAAVLAVHAHVKRMGSADSLPDAIDELMMVMSAAVAGIWAMAGKKAALESIDFVRARTEIGLGAAPEGEPDAGLPATPMH